MSERVSKWETHQERWGMRERTGGSVSEWTGKRANKRISKKWVGDRGAICQCKWPGNRCAKSNKNQVFERFVFSTTGWKVNHLSNSAKAISPIIGKRFMVYDITMSPNAIDSRYCLVWFICCLPQLPCFLFQIYSNFFLFVSLLPFPTLYIYICVQSNDNWFIVKVSWTTKNKLPLCEIFGVCTRMRILN